uniref:Uncharacterized protein n=1 Tax=Cucumis sativus TaxID=3659 RepID=A0A0A0K4S3_CUCSA
MAKRLAGEICGDHAVEENQKSMRMEVLVMAVEIELRRLEALKMAEDVDLGDLFSSRLIGLERNMDDDVHLRPKEKSWVLVVGLSFHNGPIMMIG